MFLSYLWGMETKHSWSGYTSTSYVLILPMRNGNIDNNIILQYCNYNGFLSYLWGMETILPIRNYKTFGGFLSYLWGMETDKRLKKFLEVITFVLILPMRNGNGVYDDDYYRAKRLFLSYLWGMETDYNLNIIHVHI